MNNKPTELTIAQLLGNESYIIPIYQRNYAWGNAEITQLIQDIADYIQKDNSPITAKPNYYIGTLIAYERKIDGISIFETIDGQQRLTTLTILLSLIKNTWKDTDVDTSWYKKLNLKFDSRKNSTDTLQQLFANGGTNSATGNPAIIQGYKDAEKSLKKILIDSHLSIQHFCDYLFQKVYMLRVLVPEDTDLNHYFEIMNSRGEQLEMHEILKAQCLEILDEDEQYAFNLIWEACANMERYVQYGFTTEQRDLIFGSGNEANKWNQLVGKDEVYKYLKPKEESQKQESTNEEKKDLSIIDLLKPGAPQFSSQSPTGNENPVRFNTIINFANFLLHILRIQTRDKDIALDDKRLITLFDPYVKGPDKKEFVRQFGYNLLKGKFLFDKYIIKREFIGGTDHWSLKRLRWYSKNENASYINTFGDERDNNDENREVLMLLSMFHVSTPTLVYKHWLNGALKYLFENEDITADGYLIYLLDLADAFLFDRFLTEDKEPKDYFEIIYTNHAKSVTIGCDESKLDRGTDVENFVFNYLDYLLWQNYRGDKSYFKNILNIGGKPIEDPRIANFEYTFRSSVEHYYPQHPIEGNRKMDTEWLDNFGNLCLISGKKNSRLSNYMPKAKKDHYDKSPTIDSIKQRIMMEYENWSEEEIEEHGEMMKRLLLDKED